MIPRRIEVENFLSFGTPPVELCFDGEPLWVLSGPNGVGSIGSHRGSAHRPACPTSIRTAPRSCSRSPKSSRSSAPL